MALGVPGGGHPKWGLHPKLDPKWAGGHSNSGVGSNSPCNMAVRAGAVVRQSRLVLLLRLAVRVALAWGCGVPAAAKEVQREALSKARAVAEAQAKSGGGSGGSGGQLDQPCHMQ